MVDTPGADASRPTPIAVAVAAAVLTAVGHGAVSLANHARYGTSLDLAIFYQGLAHLVGLNPAGVAAKTPGTTLFGDHWHPVVALYAPLLLLWNSPVTLLVAQAVALGVTMGILALTWAELAPTARRAIPWVAAAAVSTSLASAAVFDVHEVALGSPLVALLCRAVVRRRLVAATLWGLACLTIKEDMAALLVPFGVVIAVLGRRALGVALAVAAVAWDAAAIGWVIPAFNLAHSYTYTSGGLLASAPRALLHAYLVPGLLTITMLLVLASLGGRFRTPWLLLPVAGSIAYRGLVDNFRYWVPFYHYWLLPWLCAAFATAGWVPEKHRAGDRWRAWLVGVVAVASVLVGPESIQLWSTRDNQPGRVAAALATIPDGARVAADPRFTPHLAARTVVSAVRPPTLVDGNGRPMPDVDWVVLDRATTSYGGGWVDRFVSTQLGGFQVVRDDGRLLVLRRR